MILCRVSKRGYWRNNLSPDFIEIFHVRLVSYTGTCLADARWGELRAYFNLEKWDTDLHGMVYTDPGWMDNFRVHLRTMGFSDAAVSAVDYSEAGMQGSDYVSMDVGGAFIHELDPLFRFAKGIDQARLRIPVTVDEDACCGIDEDD